ncbi:MAG TPA: glycosyltransferase [Patescibacteria group bacterium]|nr:glycosyltransferase [Patescibacteria group bacterium]
MKIIYIANARIPTAKAHGYQIAKMCEEFSLAGVQTELWLPGRANAIAGDLFGFYGVKKVFKVVELKSVDFIKSDKYLGRFSFWLQTAGFMIRLLSVKVDKDSVIYTRHPEIIWLFSVKGCRTVYEAHRWPGRRAKLHNFLVKQAAKVIVLTESLKELFLKSGFGEAKVMVVPDGVDLKIFDLDLTKEAARAQLGLSQNKIILGYTGSFKTMGRDKGLVDVLKSLRLLAPERPDVLFMAVGGSKQDIGHYQKIADELGLKNRILLLARVDLDKLAVYQKAFDILLMPFPNREHYARYMSPLKMFEYMAARRPVIATDLPSIREVLSEANAVLVKPDNPYDLARGIKEILANPDLAEKLANQAFLDAKDYSWGRRVWKIINFIQ